MSTEQQMVALAARLREAGRITVLTGAGVSAASGVPTFRGAGGLWKNYSAQDLATPQAFRKNPALVWEWYNWRRELVAKCRPNAAHHVLAAWSRRSPGFQLITQNVDGLHERAGTEGVLRFHGSIWEVQCWERCPSSPERWRDETVPFPELPPRCPYCCGLLRPGVVWFGEAIDPEILERSFAAARCDLFLSVGTSTVVYPAAGLAHEAKRHGAFTAEINPEETPASELVDISIRMGAEQALPEIERLFETPDKSADG